MGNVLKLKIFRNEVMSSVFETIDLFHEEIQTAISGNTIRLYTEEWTIKIVADETGHFKTACGIHTCDLDAYDLSDKIEEALREGYPAIYIHGGAAMVLKKSVDIY